MSFFRRGYGYVAGAVLIWAGFLLVSRLGGRSVLTPWDITALRFGTAAVLLMPYLIHMGWARLFNWRMFLLAWTGGLGYALIVYAGFSHAPATHAAILMPGMLPFFTTIMAYVLQKQAVDHDRRVSLLFMAAGVICMLAGLFQHGDTLGQGDWMFLVASWIWSVYTVLLRRWNVSAWDATAGVAGLSALMYGPVYGLFLPSHLHQAAWSAVLLQSIYQGVLVVIVAMVLYTRAVAMLGAVKVGVCMALVPGLGSLLAVLFIHEVPDESQILALCLIAAGALQPWTWWRSQVQS